MKITTWNINGLRAVIEKGLYSWVTRDQPDVLCLQEIKCRPDQLNPEHLSLEGYQIYWNPAKRPGYSGVAIYSKVEPQDIIYGLGEPAFDDEGRVIRMRFKDFWLYNIYFPNGQRDLGRLTYKLDFYAYLLEQCDALHQKGESLIITGDFNTAHREIDLKNPKENEHNSGFLPEEREWVDRYLQHGFVDAFREFYPERQQYTWWTYRLNARARNIGWRLDYYLVTKSLMARIKDVVIQDQVLGSDHCPVDLIME
jgi:exodeoxyribonuclease-3